AIAEIKELLIKRHSNKEDFTITSQSDILSTMQTILTIMTGVLAGIAGISLVVGGIGIMNIMLVSVRERTREIGIRKAIGARHKDILIQFLIEAITLSILGGIIGIILGAGFSIIIPYFLPFYLPTQVTLWSVLLAFFFSMAVGIFFGIYPARKASLLDPIESLRYE
ncbi:MAG: FtsX-like permease family protein, partial [Nitrospirota bacterium]